MSSSFQLSQAINNIVEELSLEECKRMLYLCEGPNAVNVRDLLMSILAQMQQDQIFLVELLLRMRRYDLLKRVLGVSKKEAEVLLENRHVLSDYRVLMTELSEDIGTDDLASLKFLLVGTLPKDKLEKFECFLDVVVELEKLDQISSSKMEIMEKYMRAIRRIDLVKRLHQYHSRMTGESPRQRPMPVNSRGLWPCRNTSLNPVTGLSAASCSSVRHLSTPCVSSAATRSASPSNTYQLNSLSGFPSASCNISRPCVSSAVNQKISRNITFQQRQEAGYQMQSVPRGLCLIIDCIGTDGVKLKETFLNLHFNVSLHLLLNADDMHSTLKQISRQDHFKGDAFICCIISRSCSSRLLGTDLDGPGLHLNSVRHIFNPNSCPGLAGKPKLFFIQGYEVPEPCQLRSVRDYVDRELETDSPVPSFCKVVEVAEDADVFWSQCWTNEKQLEKSNHHSVYLHAVRDALVEGQRRRIHLVDVHMTVNRAVYIYNGSNPGSEYHINLRHTLRKNVYLT